MFNSSVTPCIAVTASPEIKRNTFMKIPSSCLRYWLAMNASAVQSAAHATKAFLATAGAHVVQDSIPALNLPQIGAVFAFAFVLEVFNWLDAHPLSALIPAEPPTHQISAK
jgi:hypothetical protein